MNKEIVIVSAVRTPIGRLGGTLKSINSSTLAALVMKEAIRRATITPEQVDEVILGEVRQSSMSSNVARVAALLAGIPVSTPAFTVNRLCASGMQALVSGTQQIEGNHAQIVIVGGTENMSNAPIYLRNSRYGEGTPHLVDSNLENGQQPVEIYGTDLGMGMTAENVADQFQISREDQDLFAFKSQQKADRAIRDGNFVEEIVPVEIKEKYRTYRFDKDEHPRPETTKDKLAQLRPAFKKNGSVTAGNACGRNDGAAALVIMSADKAKELQLQPLARIVDWATAGVSPEMMGIGPVPAVKKLLQRTNKNRSEIGLIELNEAFSAQALAVIRELKLDENRVNVNGGAIALGHPLGATGARIITTLIYEMGRRKERYGIATLCVGGGQGMAVLLERL
ncbi:thiolase family protein [Brevibacillus fluminis]|uniref:acetyl-CoA C-acetyltransferase n=1 Tax=Brevibacillus fluminis TaxID=511487 RepID=A0A3M8DJ71_9BACL|nr:thiolase family protein [Brevibacillus fluminis]RNB87649.1 thiolase family protein [Brevibacillus fluminis]